MAMQGKLVLLVAMVIAMLAILVSRSDATYGSPSFTSMEFGTPGLAAELEDLRMGMYSSVEGDEVVVDDEFLDEPTRRMLATARRSYISYGALNGNRSPCPARSGRSYYTPNCNTRAGPAQPYRRGCYQITRCARG